MKYLFALVFAFLINVSDAWASKVVTHARKVTLTDGRVVTIGHFGDEHYSYYVSSDGELIIRDGKQWRVATEQEQSDTDNAICRVQRRVGENIYATDAFPHVGTPRALVILVSFSDLDFTYSKTELETLFNGRETTPIGKFNSYSSLAQYMDDCSDGQFRPVFDVVGPYKLDKPYSYYGKNNGAAKDINFSQFIADACRAADADVDFNKYDSDGNGTVDLVYLLYAGYGENMAINDGSEDYMWPKSGTGGTTEMFDGMRINRYGINNELIGDPEHGPFVTDKKPVMAGIGVLTHEFCHTLGLPDVYPTVRWQDVTMYDNQSMEFWDLMDNGENNYNGYAPTPLTAFERELFGWITIETLTEPANIEMRPLKDGGKAYRIINDADENEYYILEVIPTGDEEGWYKYMRGNGLLVTHIRYNQFKNFIAPNNTPGKPRWTLVPADGIVMSSYRMQLDKNNALYIKRSEYYADHAGDTYPGTKNMTALSDYKAYTGTVDKPLTDITQNGKTVSFKFMGGSTGIDNVNLHTGNAVAYNLKGQRVGDDYRGIVIVGGKKVVRR